MKIISIFHLLLLIILNVYPQEKANIWQPFDYFIGDWEGHETGKAGIGMGERSYRYIMKGKYLLLKNISRFEPQEKNPEGEVHEDWAIFSYDKNREALISREFNIEGFVNQYILDSLVNDHSTFIFISESSENAPPGLRARLTYEIQNESEFVETFELSFPGKKFEEWLKNYWKRKK
jgi:hypothetical protein